MDTSYCKEYSKKQGDVARRKKVKEEEAGSGNSSTDSVRQCRLLNLGLDQITKFIYQLDGSLGEGNA
jgi:hypothetical protein